MPETYLTPAAWAQRMGVTTATVHRWVRQKKIPALRVGQTIRIDPEAALAALHHSSAQCRSCPPPPIHALHGLPSEVREQPTWLIRERSNLGGLNTMPPVTGLLTFQAAVAQFNPKTECVGLALPIGWLALRLDGAFDSRGETTTFIAQRIIEKLGSYTDINTQTGTIYILLRAMLPVGFSEEPPEATALDFRRMRILGPGNCIPLTGVSVSDAPCRIADAQIPLADLLVNLGFGEGGMA